MSNKKEEPVKLSELIEALKSIADEAGPCHGLSGDELEFYLDGNFGLKDLELAEIEPKMTAGCGCWYGANVTFRDPEEPKQDGEWDRPHTAPPVFKRIQDIGWYDGPVSELIMDGRGMYYETLALASCSATDEYLIFQVRSSELKKPDAHSPGATRKRILKSKTIYRGIRSHGEGETWALVPVAAEDLSEDDLPCED